MTVHLLIYCSQTVKDKANPATTTLTKVRDLYCKHHVYKSNRQLVIVWSVGYTVQFIICVLYSSPFHYTLVVL